MNKKIKKWMYRDLKKPLIEVYYLIIKTPYEKTITKIVRSKQ